VPDRLVHEIQESAVPGEWKVSTWVGNSLPGFLDGARKSACLLQPYSVAVDSKGRAYVADRNNNRIRLITPKGIVTTLAGNNHAGHLDGVGTKATFSHPTGVAVDSAGYVYVADSDKIRKISPSGIVTTLLDGGLEKASFHDVAVDTYGGIYFSDKKKSSNI